MLYTLTYKCPCCGRPIARDISYDNLPALTISTRCPRCESVHEYKIQIVKKKGQPFLHTLYFLCNEEKMDIQPTLRA